ncbi:MAG: zinc-ribbon domain-containing protein [Ruminococcaceae bacterium]|nr:zinc-ribbon domain-containing protein [Oscillospiraceae bacterium]
MVKCTNCGKELADGSKFCDACGSKIEAVAPVSEPAYEPTVAEPVYEAPASEAPVNEAPAPEKKKSGKVIGIVIGFVAAVFVLIIAIILISVFAGGGYKGNNYALYYKDGEINYTNLPSVKPFEVSDDDGDSPRITPDGKYIVYIDGDDSTLMIRPTGNAKKAPVEIKDEVDGFSISENSKYIVFENDDGDLYEYNISKKQDTKIKNEVDGYYISGDGKKITYYIYSDDSDYEYSKDYYIRTLGKDNDEKIASEVYSFAYVDYEKAKEFYFTSDSDLYFCKVGKDKVKIDTDVSAICNVFEDGSLYYKKSEESDDGFEYDLCYYTGKGKPSTVFSGFASVDYETSAVETPVAVFSVCESFEDDDEAVSYVVAYGNASEITHDDAMSFNLTEDGSALYYLADCNYEGGKDEDDADETDYAVSSDDYDYDWDEYDYDYPDVAEVSEFENATLYLAKIGKKGITKTSEYDKEVYDEITLIDNKTIVYFKDYDIEDDCGTLYVNKKEVDNDVDGIGYYFTESKNFMYVKNQKDNTATLYYCKNGRSSVKVADDVYNAAFTGEGDIIYLKDYDTEDYEGDLMLFTGRKSKEIDSEVSSFVVDYTANNY